MRDAVHRRLVDGGVFVDRRFDLGGVDVLAAAQDHVLGPVAHVDESLLVDVTDVARAQPAVDDRVGGGVGPVPVRANQHRTLEPDLTGLAGRQHVAEGIGDPDVHHRDDATRRGRLREEVVAEVSRAVCVGLGHAVPEARPALGEVVLDALHELGWHRGAAAADGQQTRGVALLERRCLQQVPTHGRDADERRHAFAFDQLEGAVRIPPVGHHEFRSADERAEHHRHQPGDVEQRDRQHHRALGLVGIGLRRLPHCVDGRAGGERHQRTEHRPVGGDSSLRITGRAGGVQDRGVVVRVDVDVGQCCAVGQQILQRNHAERVVRSGFGVFADGHHRGGDRARIGGSQPVEPVGVGDDDLRAGVVEGEHDLSGLPPRVHRNRHRSDGGDRGERGDPFRVVAHRDRDAIAVGDAELVDEGVTDPTDQLQHLWHRPAFVLEHDEVVGARRCGGEQVTQVRRRAGEHLGRRAEDVDFADLERGTGRADGRARFVEVHSHVSVVPHHPSVAPSHTVPGPIPSGSPSPGLREPPWFPETWAGGTSHVADPTGAIVLETPGTNWAIDLQRPHDHRPPRQWPGASRRDGLQVTSPQRSSNIS